MRSEGHQGPRDKVRTMDYIVIGGFKTREYSAPIPNPTLYLKPGPPTAAPEVDSSAKL